MKFTAFKTIHALLLSQTASAALGEIITTIDRNGEQIVMMTDDGANDIARSPPSIADITDSSTAVIVDIPVCENDVDFIIPFKGEPKSCQDIGMDDTVRRELCKYETVTSHCPNICGVCCLDNSDFFFPGELTGDPRTCAWITKNVKKTEVRRENHCESKINGAVVKDQCQISCDFCFEPVQTCFNDADFLSQEFEGRERSCKNIRLDESRRNTLCQFDDVRKACPQSCGFCCVSDATYRFKSVDKKKRTCKWISRRNTAARRFKYCKKFLNGATVRDKCPEACDFCFDPVVQSQSPSSTPSKTPQRNTKSPTPVPTKGPTKAPVPAPVRPPVLAPVLPAPVPLPSSNPSVSIVPSLSMTPSVYPSDLPSVSLNPSSAPSDLPSTSANPSAAPSDIPSLSMTPSAAHSDLPSVSLNPSSAPSDLPSTSANPSAAPSDIPSLSMTPSAAHSDLPSVSLNPSSSSAPTLVNNCNGDEACTAAIDNTIKNGGCVGDRACYLANTNIIGNGGCVGNGACYGANNSTIGDGGCVGVFACEGASTNTIGDGGCVTLTGFYACYEAFTNIIGNGGCNGNGACDSANTNTIGDGGCDGFQVCYGASTNTIGDGGCVGYGACYRANNSTIGGGGCNGVLACRDAIDNIIGANSCNCDGCCKACDGSVPANACNTGNDDIVNGRCTYC